MAFILQCKHCSQKFRVREAFVGRKFKCKACGRANEITEIPIEAPEPVPVKKSSGEIPVSMALPPVVSRAKKKPKKKVEDDAKSDIAYDLMSGRAGVLGQFDEEEADAQRKVMMQVGGVFGGVFLLMVIGGIVYNRMNNSPEKLVPQEYEEYNFVQGAMKVDVPKGWEVKAGGGGNIPEFLTLKGRKVTITMRANPRGSIMGGVQSAFNGLTAGDVAPADETEPVHTAHVSIGQMIGNEYVDYEETPPKVLRPTGFGSARICRYQGGTQFGSTEYGFRATVESSQGLVYRILMQMPEWHRDDFEPAAEKIIASMRPEIEDDFMDDEEEVEVDPEAMKEEVEEVDPFTNEPVGAGSE